MRRFGLIGHPIGHSFSPAYFERKFSRERIDGSYEAIDLEVLSGLRSHPRILEMEGFNVTIPHKEEILDYLDEISDEAAEVGAVNCVRIKDGVFKGYNTDVHGFVESLRPLLQEVEAPKALILGSGGSSKAVQAGLAQLNIEFQVVSRTGTLTYEALDASTMRQTTYIMNTTPLGMFPHVDGYPDIPYEAITKQHVCFDLIYNPGQSNFLRKCSILGATTKNGQEMLELQAEKSWDLWNQASL